MEKQYKVSIVVDSSQALDYTDKLAKQFKILKKDASSLSRTMTNLNKKIDAFSESVKKVPRNFFKNIERSAKALDLASKSSSNANVNLKDLGRTLSSIDKKFDNLSSGLNKFSSNVTKDISNLKKEAKKTNSSLSRTIGIMGELRGIAGASIFGYSLINAGLQAIKTADSMQSLTNQIQLVTTSSEQLELVQNRLLLIANQNRTSVEATTNLYTNSARALANLGKTQQEVLDFTNAVSQAMFIGGKSANEQASAILQLGQAMQSGRLQGDEFRSIAENAPILLDLVSESLGVTRAEVRELATDGKITADILYNALTGASGKMASEMGSMTTTVSQSFQVLLNNLKTKVGDFLNSTSGISGGISSAILSVANNLDVFLTVGLTAGGIYVTSLVSKIGFLRNAFLALNVAVRANPIVAVASAVAVVSSTFVDWGSVIKYTTVILADLIRFSSKGLIGLANLARSVVANMSRNVANFINFSNKSFGGFFEGTGRGFVGFATGVGRIFDAMAGTVRGFAIYGGRMFASFITKVNNMFARMGNYVRRVFAGIINGIVSGVNFAVSKVNSISSKFNSFSDKLGLGSIPQLSKISNIKVSQTSISKAPSVGFSGALADGFRAQRASVEGLFKSYAKSVSLRVNKEGVKELKDVSGLLNQAIRGAKPVAKGIADGLKKKGKKKKGGSKRKKRPNNSILAKSEKEAIEIAEKYNNTLADLDKRIALVSKKSHFDRWKYDLNDVNNKLSKLSKNLKDNILDRAYTLDVKIAENKAIESIRNIKKTIQTADLKSNFQKWTYKLNDTNDELFKISKTLKNELLDQAYELDVKLADNKILDKIEKIKKELASFEVGGFNNYQSLDYDIKNGDYSSVSSDKLLEFRKLTATKQFNDTFNKDSDEEKEALERENKRAQLEEAKQLGIISEQRYREELLRIQSEYHEKRTQLELTKQNGYFNIVSNGLGLIAGKNSRTYKAMFRAKQAHDFLTAQSSSLSAIAQAWSSAPFPANLGAVAVTTAKTGIIGSAIKALSSKAFSSGGYTGDANETTAVGVVHGQEYVVNARNTKRYKTQLDKMNNGTYNEGTSNVNVNVNVVNNVSDVEVIESRNDDGVTLTLVKKLVKDGVKKAFGNLDNANSYESKQVSRNFTKRAR